MKEELYEEVLDLLMEKLGFKCQPSELEELAEQIIDSLRQVISEDLY